MITIGVGLPVLQVTGSIVTGCPYYILYRAFIKMIVGHKITSVPDSSLPASPRYRMW